MIMQNPYSIKSVGDDYIIVDTDCFEITKASLEMDLQRSFTSIEQIVLLPPLVIEPISLVDSTEYPYINFKLNHAVRFVRRHLRMDFKSSSKITYFGFR